MTVPGPKIAYLQPTGRCNLHCIGCYATLEQAGRHSSKRELSASEYGRAVAQLHEMGVRIFDISGGEPLMYRSIVELCEAISALPDSRIWLVTNGTVKRRGIVASLAPLVDRWVISLDAPAAGPHDLLRGRAGAFDLALAMLREVREHGVRELAVNQLVTPANVDSVPDMLGLCRRESVDRLALLQFRDVSENGVMSQAVPLLPLQQDMWTMVVQNLEAAEWPQQVDIVVPAFLHAESRAFWRSLSPSLRGRIAFRYPNLRGVGGFRDAVVVKPFGRVTGDTAMVNDAYFEIGSIRGSIQDLWQEQALAWQKRLSRRQEILRARAPCRDCTRWNVCRGGCPAAARHQWGDMNHHDRTCDHFRAAWSEE